MLPITSQDKQARPFMRAELQVIAGINVCNWLEACQPDNLSHPFQRLPASENGWRKSPGCPMAVYEDGVDGLSVDYKEKF